MDICEGIFKQLNIHGLLFFYGGRLRWLGCLVRAR